MQSITNDRRIAGFSGGYPCANYAGVISFAALPRRCGRRCRLFSSPLMAQAQRSNMGSSKLPARGEFNHRQRLCDDDG